jgi:hypothetical protein
MKLFKLVLCSLVFSQAAFAEELLFTGQVQSISIQPSGVGQCRQACADTPPGMVCVSNQGGCQDAELKVLKDHLGSRNGATLHFASRTGEWGRLNFPDSGRPILVYAKDGQATWAPLTLHGDKAYFQPNEMHGEIRQVAQAFMQDEGGEVALDQLIEKLRGQAQR